MKPCKIIKKAVSASIGIPYLLYIFLLIVISQSIGKATPIESNNIVSYKYQRAVELPYKCGIALFQKKEHIWWLVLDQSFPNIAFPQDDQLPPGIESCKQIDNFKSIFPCSILELKLSIGVIPSVVRETNDKWILTTNVDQEINKENEVAKLQYTIDNNYNLSLHPIQHSHDFLITDNESKMTYYVVPCTKLNGGIKALDVSPYLDILNSSQGFACIVRTDMGEFKIKDEILTFTLNAKPIIYNEKTISVGSIPLKNLLFADKTNLDWIQYRKAIYDYIAHKPNAPLTKKIEKVWVDLAMGYGEEALYNLRILEKNDQNVSRKPVFQYLLAMAYLLKGNFKNCTDVLKNLPPLPELEMWRFLCIQENQTWPNTSNLILLQYPPYLKSKLLLLLLPKAFQKKRIDILDSIFTSPLKGVDSYVQAFFDLYYAKYLQLKNQQLKNQALKIYQKLAKDQGAPKKVQVESAYYLFLEEIDKKSNKEVVDFLDKLRFEWRGDDLEIMIVCKLIEYLKKQKDYIRIINIIKNMQPIYVGNIAAQKLSILLSKAIGDYFNQDLNSIKTIALFNDLSGFIGHDEKIVNKIVELYIEIDLLPQAAELLEKNIERIEDLKAKTPLLLKLADLYIKNDKADLAQKTLDKVQNLNSKYFKDLQILIHIKKQNFPLAIKLLEEDSSEDNLIKISTIYQGLENWAQMADTLNTLLIKLNEITQDKESIRDKKNIRALKAETIIRIGCAYYLMDRFVSLAELKKNYLPFMEETPKEQFDLFKLLTEEKSNSNILKVEQIIAEDKILQTLSQNIGNIMTP